MREHLPADRQNTMDVLDFPRRFVAGKRTAVKLEAWRAALRAAWLRVCVDQLAGAGILTPDEAAEKRAATKARRA